MIDQESASNRDNDESRKSADDTQIAKQNSFYPEVDERLKQVAVWLAVAFIVGVFLVQNFSGFW